MKVSQDKSAIDNIKCDINGYGGIRSNNQKFTISKNHLILPSIYDVIQCRCCTTLYPIKSTTFNRYILDIHFTVTL